MSTTRWFPLGTSGIAAVFVALVFAAAPPGAYGQELPLQLTWVDRTGKAIESIGPPGAYRGPDVSTDGRVAVHQHDRNGGDIWLLDPKGQMTRFTADATGTQENSQSDLFTGRHSHRVRLAAKRQMGAVSEGRERPGGEELLYESGSRKMPMAWSPDGQFIVYWVASGAGQWVMPVKNPSAARPLHDRQNTHAQISPDGKWVAFNSLNQIYVKPFPSGEGLWKVSTDTRRLCAMAWRLEGAVFPEQGELRSDDGRGDQRHGLDSAAGQTARAVRQPIREPQSPEQLPHVLGCG